MAIKRKKIMSERLFAQFPINLRIVFAAIVVILSACSSLSPSTPTATYTELAEQEATQTVSATETRTAPPTGTPTVALTPTATSTLTAAITQTLPPTPTPTPVPTLPEIEAGEYLGALLADPGQCELPCLWGLEPGKNSLNDVFEVLGPLGLEGYENPNARDDFDRYSLTVASNPFVYAGFTVYGLEDTFVNINVRFSFQVAPNTELSISPQGLELLTPYSLSSMMGQFGEPTRVLIELRAVASEPGDGTWLYQVWVFYAQHGILVFYEGRYDLPKVGEDTIIVCPSYEELNRLRLYLQSPDSESPLDELVYVGLPKRYRLEGRLETGELKHWEDATGLTLSDFYNLFVDPQGQSCFQSPTSIWD